MTIVFFFLSQEVLKGDLTGQEEFPRPSYKNQPYDDLVLCCNNLVKTITDSKKKKTQYLLL